MLIVHSIYLQFNDIKYPLSSIQHLVSNLQHYDQIPV